MQLVLEQMTSQDPLPHVFVEQRIASLAGALCFIHCRVGIANQVANLCEYGMSNGDTDSDPAFLGHTFEGTFDAVAEVPSNPIRRLGVMERRLLDEIGIERSELPLETDGHQQLVETRR